MWLFELGLLQIAICFEEVGNQYCKELCQGPVSNLPDPSTYDYYNNLYTQFFCITWGKYKLDWNTPGNRHFRFIGCHKTNWVQDLKYGPQKSGYNIHTCYLACRGNIET